MTIYETIGSLLAAFAVSLLAYLSPKVKEWLVARTGKDHYDQLVQLVTAFARAAEQLYKNNDPDGSYRNRFVRGQLEAMGIEITEAVMNMIEGVVWEINTENRQVQVQTKEIVAGGGIDGSG